MAPPQTIPHAQVMRVLYGLMSGMFLAAIEQTIVATAPPTIFGALGGLDRISWVVTAYLVSTTGECRALGQAQRPAGPRATYLAAIPVFGRRGHEADMPGGPHC